MDRPSTSVRPRALAGWLLSVGAVAGGLAAFWTVMLALAALGGSCASGGPYAARTACPDSVTLVAIPSILAILAGSAGIRRFGGRLGPAWGAAVRLVWPAGALLLGATSLWASVRTPDGGIAWGWVLCGVVFLVGGALPGRLRLRGEGSRPEPTPPLLLLGGGAAAVAGAALGLLLAGLPAGA